MTLSYQPPALPRSTTTYNSYFMATSWTHCDEWLLTPLWFHCSSTALWPFVNLQWKFVRFIFPKSSNCRRTVVESWL